MLSQSDLTSSDSLEARNAVKMFAYVLHTICIDEEAASVKVSKHTFSTTAQVCIFHYMRLPISAHSRVIHLEKCSPIDWMQNAKGKKASSKALLWQWNNERANAVQCMTSLLSLDVARLWPMSCAEEQFITYVFLANHKK
jgi:hypothetical protein